MPPKQRQIPSSSSKPVTPHTRLPNRMPMSDIDIANTDFRRSALQSNSRPRRTSTVDAERGAIPEVNREVTGALGSVLGKNLVNSDSSLSPAAIKELNSMLTTRGVGGVTLEVNKILVVDGNPPIDPVRFQKGHTELTRTLMKNPRYLKYAAVTAFILLSMFGLGDDIVRQVGKSASVVTKEVAGAVGDALQVAGDVAGDGVLAFLKGLGIDPYMMSASCACISILMVVAFAMSMFA